MDDFESSRVTKLRRSKHYCHARECLTTCAPKFLMCPIHWRLVAPSLQQEVYQHYRPGQETDKMPSVAWHDAASAAIGFVALVEERVLTTGEVRLLVERGYRDEIVAAHVKRVHVEAAVVERAIDEILQGAK